MRKFERLPKPEILAEAEAEITADYINRRAEKPGYQFQWPQKEGVKLNQHLLPVLKTQTEDHCSYCDGFPLQKGNYTIDHFQPKSQPAFYHLVVEWTNLYLCCHICQQKSDNYNDFLLRPDAADYQFEEYFIYEYNSQELKPNPAKPATNQLRASETIRIFDLNHPGLISSRELMWDLFQRNQILPPEERRGINRYGFRFMFIE
jgi:uncharacterized protein (TIGR02646 family)